jgi:hypothetical protein
MARIPPKATTAMAGTSKVEALYPEPVECADAEATGVLELLAARLEDAALEDEARDALEDDAAAEVLEDEPTVTISSAIVAAFTVKFGPMRMRETR